MAVKQRQIPALKPCPWPEILTLEERGQRLRERYEVLRESVGLSQEQISRDIGLSRGVVSQYLSNPPIDFAIKFCYLYGIDIIDVYPELVFMRDRWLKEFEMHFALMRRVLEEKNVLAAQNILQAMENGLALYLTPEFLGEMKRLKTEATQAADLERLGQTRRRNDETHQEARMRGYAQALDS